MEITKFSTVMQRFVQTLQYMNTKQLTLSHEEGRKREREREREGRTPKVLHTYIK